MTFPSDLSDYTSEALSALIAHVLNDDQVPQPATLASVREAVLAEVETVTLPLNRFSTDQWQQLREEVEVLIENHGDEALAEGFLRPWASDALRLLIDAALDAYGELTLAGLFEAAERGLLAQLIGRGEIDDDEEQTVIDEIQHLIDQHGGDTLASEFVREP